MFDADDFRNDPYGHVTNQAGHAMVGYPMALLALLVLPPVPAFFAAWLAYGLIWEALIQPQTKGWADALMDTACVASGAALACGALFYASDFWPAWITAAVCFVAYAVVVFIGFLRRWQP